MQFLAYLAVLVIGSLVAYALAPKPPKQKPPTLEDFDLPTAEEGRSIPWIFGTYLITDPNIIWYGDLEVRTKTKNKVKTRLYRMGIQLECCIGPVDALVALHYGGKDCEIAEVTSSQQITISKPNLFGGREKEGGIDGDFDICFGEPTQGVNDYLQAQLGTPLSAFRDSLTIVGRKPSLVANSTYIKPLHPTVRCIEQGWADGACWYPETASTGDEATVRFSDGFTVDNIDDYIVAFGDKTPFTIFTAAAGVMIVSNTGTHCNIYREISPDSYTGFSVDFCITASGANDCGTVTISGDSWWLQFVPRRTSVIDPARRCRVLYTGSNESQISASALDFDTWYTISGVINYDDGSATITLAEREGAVVATVDLGVGVVNGPVTNYGFSSSNDSAGYVMFDNLRLSAPAGWDMNPAHIIYKVLTDTDQGLSEPSATIDDGSFRAAALTFWTEGMGLSTQWRNEGSISDFIAEVCRHAGAVLSLDPQTGLTQLIPLRDDYDVDALDLITENEVIEVIDWQDAADGEAVNEVTVEYRERDGRTGSVTWANRASIQQAGLIHETMGFPMVSRRELALRIAKRECLQRSSNLSRGKIKVNRAAWDKLPGAVFRFAHDGEGIDEVVVRVVDIDIGTLTDGAITVTVVQDIFSLDATLTDGGDQDSEWEQPDADPAAPAAQDVLEAPYWQLLADLGPAYVAALADAGGWMIPLAAQPTSLALGVDCWPTIPPGGSWESSTDLPFMPCAELTAALARDGTTITWSTVGVITPDAEIGDLVMIGTGATAEFCRLTAFGSGTASLSRGMLDTTPQEHASGARVWFLPTEPEDWPRDRYAWISWAPGSMKLLTRAPSGILDASDATAITVTPSERQVRPYPPGDIQIGGQSWPSAPLDGSPAVTWAHRDRVTQGSTVVLQDDATDYGPEAGTTYNVWAYDDTDDTLLDSGTAITGTTWTPTITISTRVRIETEAERDGYVSWQRQVRTYEYIPTGGILTEASDYLLTEAGDYLITET